MIIKKIKLFSLRNLKSGLVFIVYNKNIKYTEFYSTLVGTVQQNGGFWKFYYLTRFS